MHLQPGGDLPLRMTVTAWKGFYADRQDWVIVPTVLPPLPVSVMMLTNLLSGLPATNSQHLLHPLLPPEREQYYSLREQSHNYQLPERTTQLKDKTS